MAFARRSLSSAGVEMPESAIQLSATVGMDGNAAPPHANAIRGFIHPAFFNFLKIVDCRS